MGRLTHIDQRDREMFASGMVYATQGMRTEYVFVTRQQQADAVTDTARRVRQGAMDSLVAFLAAPPEVHHIPPDGEAVTPCCGKTVFELPRGDRVTLERSEVTCNRGETTTRGTRR